jgi:epoxyqueuosine reductase
MVTQIQIPSIPLDLLHQNGIGAISLVHEAKTISFDKYLSWVDAGYAGPLKYLTDDRKNKRASLKKLYPNFQAAVVFLFPYSKTPSAPNGIKIADYVFAFNDEDYHHVLPNRIKNFFEALNVDETRYQVVVDTQPILERDLAYRSGLGWIGKNSMLINRNLGSYFLIATAIFESDIQFQDQYISIQSSRLETDHCGSCRACLDACPTNAILENERQINANLCISTYTIENFSYTKTPPLASRETNEVFGCDICQTVCPWNNKVQMKNFTEHQNSIIYNNFYLNSLADVIKNFLNMSKRNFKKLFISTPIARTGRDGMVKNLKDKLL